MTDLPDSVDLQWIGKTLLAIQRDQAAFRDELLVTNARIDYVERSLERIEALIKVLALEMHAVRNELTRMGTRITALEA